MPASDPISQLIAELAAVGLAARFELEEFGRIDHWPLIVLSRSAEIETPDTRRIYLSAGIHGDEPAGPQALLQLLRTDALPSIHHYIIFPVLNPAGLAAGTRENPDRIDLNRDYEYPTTREVRQHLAWIDAHIESNDISLLLHEDLEGLPESLYLLQKYRSLSYTLETPSARPLEQRVAAHTAIVQAIL